MSHEIPQHFFSSAISSNNIEYQLGLGWIAYPGRAKRIPAFVRLQGERIPVWHGLLQATLGVSRDGGLVPSGMSGGSRPDGPYAAVTVGAHPAPRHRIPGPPSVAHTGEEIRSGQRPEPWYALPAVVVLLAWRW